MSNFTAFKLWAGRGRARRIRVSQTNNDHTKDVVPHTCSVRQIQPDMHRNFFSPLKQQNSVNCPSIFLFKKRLNYFFRLMSPSCNETYWFHHVPASFAKVLSNPAKIVILAANSQKFSSLDCNVWYCFCLLSYSRLCYTAEYSEKAKVLKKERKR